MSPVVMKMPVPRIEPTVTQRGVPRAEPADESRPRLGVFSHGCGGF